MAFAMLFHFIDLTTIFSSFENGISVREPNEISLEIHVRVPNSSLRGDFRERSFNCTYFHIIIIGYNLLKLLMLFNNSDSKSVR